MPTEDYSFLMTNHSCKPCKPLVSDTSKALSGRVRVCGDKSISHRAVILGGLCVGRTEITGLLESEDIKRTLSCMSAMGCELSSSNPGNWIIQGCGIGGLAAPEDILDMGNSGTTARLLMGVLAGHNFTSFLTGDKSLRHRPMKRVLDPLRDMGATFVSRDDDYLPLAVTGTHSLLPLTYKLPVASAQVKSALLLCGLHAPGETTIIEPKPTRDHTELMLRHFGATIHTTEHKNANRTIRLIGQPELNPHPVTVPADPSSAAFPLVAALLVPDSEIVLEAVGLNPLRTGLFDCLQEMGAAITFENKHTNEGGEIVGDLRVHTSKLQGIDVPAERVPSMIDEYPILAIAAACAKGTTRMNGLAELRVKESDRLAALARGLTACGVDVEEGPDWLLVRGANGPVPDRATPGGATIVSGNDHRIAMSFLVLGMMAKDPIKIDDGAPIETSFPNFVETMNRLGANIRNV